MDKYIYIDESGDLGEHGSKYFCVAGLITSNPLSIARIIKKLRQKQLKKSVKELPEIKANKSNDKIKKFVLCSIMPTDSSIIAIVIEKDKVKSQIFKSKGRLYNYCCWLLFKEMAGNKSKLTIIIDQKDTNSYLRLGFNEYIKEKMSNHFQETAVKIIHLPSFSCNQLQVVDFIAWAVSRKFNFNDAQYFNIIKDKVTNADNMLVKKEKTDPDSTF